MLAEALILLMLVVPGLTFSTLIFLEIFNIRRKYVDFLLFVFERGKERIEQRIRKKHQEDHVLKWSDNDQESDDLPKYFGSDEPREGPNPDFQFSDAFELIESGIQAIVQDQVTHRFQAEELRSWNMLTRTNRHYEFISYRLTAIWIAGFYFRYLVLMPFRACLLVIGTVSMTALTAIVGLVPNIWGLRKILNNLACQFSFRILSRVFSAMITYHNEQYKPTENGICVANHTSPIDVVILSCNSSFSLIGQKHGGFLGLLQRALARASSHIWFERSEMKDRASVSQRLKQHTQDKNKLPILIFPEGTCINNSAVMQFKKGSFEIGSIIYPVAIKYDPRFGDAFWDSSKYSYLQYIYQMMTSWAIVCDVWYLPPMTRKSDEDAVDFANRVKAVICERGGLVDLNWDGGLKRAGVKKEWKQQQQLEYAKKLSASPSSSSLRGKNNNDDECGSPPPSPHPDDDLSHDDMSPLTMSPSPPHDVDIDVDVILQKSPSPDLDLPDTELHFRHHVNPEEIKSH